MTREEMYVYCVWRVDDGEHLGAQDWKVLEHTKRR